MTELIAESEIARRRRERRHTVGQVTRKAILPVATAAVLLAIWEVAVIANCYSSMPFQPRLSQLADLCCQ